MSILALFYKPLVISSDNILWLVIPLCVSVAVVYKAIRTDNVKKLPVQIVGLVCYMIGGLIVLGTVLWAIHEYWP